jgi:hypothetical protein
MLTREETRMAVARNLEIVHGVNGTVNTINDLTRSVDGDMKMMNKLTRNVDENI